MLGGGRSRTFSHRLASIFSFFNVKQRLRLRIRIIEEGPLFFVFFGLGSSVTRHRDQKMFSHGLCYCSEQLGCNVKGSPSKHRTGRICGLIFFQPPKFLLKSSRTRLSGTWLHGSQSEKINFFFLSPKECEVRGAQAADSLSRVTRLLEEANSAVSEIDSRSSLGSGQVPGRQTNQVNRV